MTFEKPQRMACIAVLALLLCAIAGAYEADFSGLPVVGAPRVATSEKFSFVILGDKTSGGEGKWPIFDRAVDEINLLNPDFVITVGDQIPGHMQERALWDAEWAEYLEHARRIERPLLLIPGNHDIANVECYRFWKEDFGPTYYSFDYANVHFLVLNTEEERIDGRGPVWQAMLEFAERDLAAHADSRHTFVFFHKSVWDEQRYERDWARVEAALGARPFTVVAGHEHYLMAERREGNLYVIQNATGGGINLSDVREFGCFHGFGYVTVDGDAVSYAVAEPGAGLWPVDIAPAAFRKAIAHEVVQLDAAMPERLDGEEAVVKPILRFHNVLDEPIRVEVSISPLESTGWKPTSMDDIDGDAVKVFVDLAPGAKAERALELSVPKDRIPYPPAVSWRVQYKEQWIENESFPMVQSTALPLYPASAWRAPKEWKVVGPFSLGDIDTESLPEHPAEANPNLYRRFGPEDGFEPEHTYEGGLRWFDAATQGVGLLNFNGIMGTLDHALGYALCAIHSPNAQRTHAMIYSDNFAQAVLNGQLVEDAEDFGAPSGYLYVPLELRAGWNTFIVKLINNQGDWFLRVAVADPADTLEFAPAPRK